MRHRSALLLIATLGTTAAAACHQRPAVAPTVPADIVLADSADVKRVAGSLPRYPVAMLQDSVEARPIVVYVVDSSGRPDMASVRFVTDTHNEFRLSICLALRNTRWAPVMRDGVARPALFVEPYGFFVGQMMTPWTRNTPVRAVRAAIEREGIPGYVAGLASQPGC